MCVCVCVCVCHSLALAIRYRQSYTQPPARVPHTHARARARTARLAHTDDELLRLAVSMTKPTHTRFRRKAAPKPGDHTRASFGTGFGVACGVAFGVACGVAFAFGVACDTDIDITAAVGVPRANESLERTTGCRAGRTGGWVDGGLTQAPRSSTEPDPRCC